MTPISTGPGYDREPDRHRHDLPDVLWQRIERLEDEVDRLAAHAAISPALALLVALIALVVAVQR